MQLSPIRRYGKGNCFVRIRVTPDLVHFLDYLCSLDITTILWDKLYQQYYDHKLKGEDHKAIESICIDIVVYGAQQTRNPNPVDIMKIIFQKYKALNN